MKLCWREAGECWRLVLGRNESSFSDSNCSIFNTGVCGEEGGRLSPAILPTVAVYFVLF